METILDMDADSGDETTLATATATTASESIVKKSGGRKPHQNWALLSDVADAHKAEIVVCKHCKKQVKTYTKSERARDGSDADSDDN
jgi:hypothetical protein